LADLVAFARPLIGNPDLVERFANDWEFNKPAPMEVWYSSDQEGYTDFMTWQQRQKQNLTESLRK